MAKTSLRFQDRANHHRCKHFFDWAYDRYWESNRRTLHHYEYRARLYDEPLVDLPRIHGLYAQGVAWGFVNAPYSEFEPYLTGLSASSKVYRGRGFKKAPKTRPRRFRYHWCHHLSRSTYRRDPEHIKKDENPKTAWRVERKLKRDRAKNGCHRNISPHDKRVSNGRLRAWERQLIHREDWEGFHPHKRKKLTDDWW